MKLILGNKYVPHQKTSGNKDLSYSAEWRYAKEINQPYLYYTGYDFGAHRFDCDPYYGKPAGDAFNPEDVTEYIEEPNKTNNMSFEGLNTKIGTIEPGAPCHVVENEFILDAHKAACSEWKQKIETKFPDLFKKPAIERAVEKVGKIMYGRSIEIEGDYVKVPLPNANSQWTFEAFDYVKKFVQMYPRSYPVHYSGSKKGVNHDCSEFIYIDFNDND